MKIAIIGAGAAGLMCACHISQNHSVTVFEKNSSSGRKLLITGNGRCNVTNMCEPNVFLENVPQNPKFLSSSINNFTPKHMIEFLESLGVKTHIENNNRVFPITNKAETIRGALEQYAKSRGVKFVFNSNVQNIQEIRENFDAVVIATGGMSFNATGSTGDGYKFAKTLGHAIITPRPALCGLKLYNPPQIMGVSATSTQGDIMFTRFGVTGPAIFKITSMCKAQSIKDTELALDFTGANIPKALTPYLRDSKFTAKIKSFESIDTAIITRGGIDVRDINPKTMESKLVPNLYFIGEILDVDALTGGFNLQIAFSTAIACAKQLQ